MSKNGLLAVVWFSLVLYLISRLFFLNQRSWLSEEMREPKHWLWFVSLQWMNSRSESSSLQTLPRLLLLLRRRLCLLLLLPTPFGECSHPGHGRAALQSHHSLQRCHPSRKSVFKGKKASCTCLGLLSSRTCSVPPDLTPGPVLNCQFCLAKPNRLSRLRRRGTCLL